MAKPSTSPLPLSWPLLPVPDENGRITYPTLEESVRQSIEVILRTRPGEQLLRPELGAGLESMLHEGNTLETRRRIRDLVTDSIQRWEDRIVLDRVDVAEVEDAPAEVRVEIHYRLRRNATPQRIGLTVELGS